MNSSNLYFFFKALLLMVFQVFVLNNIQLMGYLNPYYYLVIILFAPIRFSQVQLLLIAFLVGLGIDWFENSGGLHASALVFLAFVRPAILRLISTKGDLESIEFSISSLGLGKFTIFTLVGVFSHHLVLFLLESFKFVEIILVVYRSILSTIFTFVLILLFELLFSKRD